MYKIKKKTPPCSHRALVLVKQNTHLVSTLTFITAANVVNHTIALIWEIEVDQAESKLCINIKY